MTYSELQDYFIQIALADPVIKSIEAVQDWSDIMELQMDRSKYPCLIVETHQINNDRESGATELIIEGAIAIVTGCPEDETPSYYSQVMTDNLNAMIRLHEQMACDADANGLFGADLSVQFDKIKKATADNCYGWRAYYVISEIEKDDA